MKNVIPSYLKHHFLIAMPHMADPNFAHTLTYIVEHTANGAMGLVVNRPQELSLADILEQLRPEIDPPARDLLEGGPVAAISTITIARHGAGPNPGYNKWPPGAKLPAAINVAFADGHVSLIPLERLWELYWHKNWNPPTSRPK